MTAPALNPSYLPVQYTEYPAAVQGWAQQALPGGGSGIEGGSVSGVYTDKIKWGIHEIDVRPDGNGFWGQRRW